MDNDRVTTQQDLIAESFRKDQEPLLRERIGITLILGCTLMPVFSLVDSIQYPQHFGRFLWYRLFAAIACLVLFVINRRWNLGYRCLVLGIAAYYAVGLIIILMILDAGGFASPYYAGLTLVFIGFCAVLPIGLGVFTLHCIILYSVYIVSVILFSLPDDMSLKLFLVNNMFLSGMLIIVLIAAWANQRFRFNEYLTRMKLRETQEQLEQYSRRLENTVAESEAKYQHVVENAYEAIVIYQQGMPKFYNERALEIFEYPETTFQTMQFARTIYPQDRNNVISRHQKLLNRKLVSQLFEFRIIDQSGKVKWVQTSDVLLDWEGRPAVLTILNDITDRVLAKQEIDKLQEQLLESQKMDAIGNLAGGVAHDFNNILQAVSGYIQLMLIKRNRTDKEYQYLSEIETTIERAGQLIQQLLAFGRRIDHKLEPVDLNQEILQACRLLERTIPKMIRIETHLAGDLWLLNADKTQFNRILMNLGSNASDAMPEGGRLLFETTNATLGEDFCRGIPDLSPGNYVLLRISDTGQGMNKDTLAHVFEPFFTTKEIGQGTGLGLASVYGIVKAHRGLITCDSIVGKGTIFQIYLPALSGSYLEMTGIDSTDEEEEVCAGNGLVLLVDDETAVLEAAAEAFRMHGYEVITAQSGEEALKIYQVDSKRIDLVVLDLSMPGIGGRKCLERIRIIDHKAKVIIASGYSSSNKAEDCIAMGAAAFIGKPYRLRHLINKAREIIDSDNP